LLNPDRAGTQIDTVRLNQWLINCVRELVTLLIFGLLGIWLFSNPLKRASDSLRARPLSVVGYGLLGLVIAFNLVLVAILLYLLIFVVGLWLGSLTLWELALAFWAVSFSALSLLLSLFVLFILYGTKIIVAYMVGVLLLNPVGQKAVKYKIVPLLLGLVIYVLLHSIPNLGWVIGIVVIALGTGATIVNYIDIRRQTQTYESSSEAVSGE
jgi:hypothetical protein